jgi:hypothetical protein
MKKIDQKIRRENLKKGQEIFMLHSFFIKRTNTMKLHSYINFTTRSITFLRDQEPKKISEGQAALNHVGELYEKKQYKEALLHINKIQETYPGCSKAATSYRGKVLHAIFEESGDLKKVRPSI